MRVQEGREFNARARVRFQNAQQALREGDHRRALAEAREARVMVARSVEASGGERAVSSMVERIESMAFTVLEDAEDYDAAPALAAELNQLAMQARSSLQRGDRAGAGERAVLAEQRARQRRGHDGRRERRRAAAVGDRAG